MRRWPTYVPVASAELLSLFHEMSPELPCQLAMKRFRPKISSSTRWWRLQESVVHLSAAVYRNVAITLSDNLLVRLAVFGAHVMDLMKRSKAICLVD